VEFWIRELKCGREDVVDQPRSGLPLIDNRDADTLSVLRHSPFETVRSIAEEVGVSAATRDDIGCIWKMGDLTLQDLQLNIVTGTNSFGFPILLTHRI
jgi:hypothetical protein